MGWVVFWVGLVVVLSAMWFGPRLRRRGIGHAGPGGRTDGADEHAVREGERGRGQSGWGMGPGMGPG